MEEDRGDYALANKLRIKMRSTNLNISPRRCIFKVPNTLLRQNPKAYLPNAFSIGPYHYGKKHLKANEKIKLMYLRDLISRFPDPEMKLMNLIGTVREVQQEARDCFAEPIDHISADEFVTILVVDGCFLIELFRKNVDENLLKDDDPIFMSSCMLQFLSHDMILLENQIPWLILKRLFHVITNGTETQPLSILALNYCYSLGLANRSESFIQEGHESKHVLDLLRNAMVKNSKIPKLKETKIVVGHSVQHPTIAPPKIPELKETGNKIKNMELNYLPRNLICLKQCLPKSAPPSEEKSKEGENKKEESREWTHLPSATRLREAGVNLKEGTSSTSILDIKFEDGDLVIPKLLIQDSTEWLFRNLICLEQCLPACPAGVTSYAKLLDDLIDTDKDMEILCESKILDNWLNLDDAAKFFNQLCNDTYITEYHYSGVSEDVEKFCQRWWPKNRRVLKRDYFNNPWAAISVSAAAFLLILAILQTVFTVIK